MKPNYPVRGSFMPNAATCVLLLAKAPNANAKTRLAGVLELDARMRLVQCMLTDTLNTLQYIPDIEVLVACSPQHELPCFDHFRDSFAWQAQPSGSLGERLAQLIRDHFAHKRQSLLVLGSDCPTLPLEHILLAIQQLLHHDIVLGPAFDGGYYLLGMRQYHRELFDNIAWSSSKVLEQTLDRVSKLELKSYLLPYWYDVDTAADLDRLRQAALIRQTITAPQHLAGALTLEFILQLEKESPANTDSERLP